MLGEGSFGRVFRAKNKKLGAKKYVAIKQIEKDNLDQEEFEMQFREIEVLKTIRKVIPGAIKLQDVFEDGYYIYTVLEYMEGHDLYEYSNNVELNETHIRRIMLQLSETLRDLHRAGVLHCDIKLENIMMSHRANSDHEVPGQAKMIDFGLSSVILPGQRCTKRFGTLAFCSPELILSNPYREGADVWSLGVCLFVLIANELPFRGSDKFSTMRRIVG